MTDDLTTSLRFVVEPLEAQGTPSMVVGSVAALAHGRSRATQGFGVVVEVSLSAVEALVEAFPPDRFYVSADAARDAVRHQTLFHVIDMESGWKVDFVPRKRRPFSKEELRRRERIEVLGVPLWVATVEDVEDTIIAELEWAHLGGGSARQLEDVAELMRLAGDSDRAYIERWVADLGLTALWTTVLA